ncbi:MAG: Bacterial regulatory protein luxR family [Sedimentibacter sp.]|jgi:DNA-binding CsgD family transcriptional regulator|nr:Bacterial regulatory protein luxR family [Sedimentibacter sp.]
MFDKLKKILIPEKNNSEEVDEGHIAGMREPDIDNERVERVSKLTPREYQLYLLLLEGYSLRECADRLNVKYPTANTHMTSTYKKLEVNTRAEFIIKYRDIRNY